MNNMNNIEYYSYRFKGKPYISSEDTFNKLLYGVFVTFVNRFPANEIAVKWNSGDPTKMFDAVVYFVNQMPSAESLEFKTGDLVKILPTYTKKVGMLAVVKSTVFPGLNEVEIETKDEETLQIAGRYLEKTKLPKEIIDMAMIAVKAKMAEKCPIKEVAPCLS